MNDKKDKICSKCGKQFKQIGFLGIIKRFIKEKPDSAIMIALDTPHLKSMCKECEKELKEIVENYFKN